MSETPKEKLNLPKPPGTVRPIGIIGHGSIGTSVAKENITAEYECASELLQCILDNPANRLTQNIRDMIETSIRLFKIQDEELIELKEVLKKYRQALININDPISYLRLEAHKSGLSIDGRALVEFANNGLNISNMAGEALERLDRLVFKQSFKNNQQTCYKTGEPCECEGLCRESY